MRKTGRVYSAVAAVALLAVLAWTLILALTPKVEPVYQGKPLRFWLRGYYNGKAAKPNQDEANAAVRDAGTNAIPTLLKMLRAHDAPLKAKLLIWASQRPFLRYHYSDPYLFNNQGFMGFQALGPDAASAVPELIKILDERISPASEVYTARSLAVIGPPAKAAVPSLLRTATNTNLLDHSDAIWALGGIHADAEKVVPVLIAALRNPSAQDQLFAAIALGKFQGDAKPAVPALLEIFRSPQPTPNPAAFQTFLWQLRFEVEKALKQIDPETYARVVPNAGSAQSRSVDIFNAPKGPF